MQAIGVSSLTMNFENCGTEATCNLYETTTSSAVGISDTDTSSYELSEDVTTITIIDDGSIDEYLIDELTSTSLIVSTVYGNTTETITLEKVE